MTTCVYNTEGKDNATIGGHAITDEMCVNYMHYYPATDLEVCKSAVSNAALENYFNFEERFVPATEIAIFQGMTMPEQPLLVLVNIRPWNNYTVFCHYQLILKLPT